MACAICEIRKPKRFCPAVRGDICAICCGTEREVTLHCPLDCPFLEDAHQHEKTPPVDPDNFPNQDIRVTEEFLHENEERLIYFGRHLMEAALDTPDAVDHDVREALEALIRTYRTLQSGVYYETRPPNPLAGAIYGHIQNAVNELRRMETENRGVPQTRDKQILGLLVFLQRMELDRNNGRRLGRAFIDFLSAFFSPREAGERPAPNLIVP